MKTARSTWGGALIALGLYFAGSASAQDNQHSADNPYLDTENLVPATNAEVGGSEQAVAQTRDAESTVDVHLADGRRLYLELDFPACVSAMTRALAIPGIGASQRLEAYEYLGSSNVVLDREEDARMAFEAMFRLDPLHRVREPSGSPKISRFVETLRRQFVPNSALHLGVQIYARIPEAARVGQPVPVRVEAECENGECPAPRFVRLFFRTDEESEWHETALEEGDEPRVFEGEVPAPLTVGRLAMFIEARDARRRVLARAGEPLVPLMLNVREEGEEPSSVLEEWWLWTLVGVVVVGAGVAVGLAIQDNGRAELGSLAPGRIELP